MRVDEDDLRIGSSWKNPTIGRMEWLGIIALGVMLGGLLHDGAQHLIANAVAKYHLEQFKQEQAKARQQTQESRVAAEVARLKAAEVVDRQQRLNSDDCRFWIQQNVINPSQRTADKVAINCR